MKELTVKVKVNADLIKRANLCELFPEEDLKTIGAWVFECYDRDRESRGPWLRRTEAAMDLAMQIQKDKSFPWSGCSNVAFPLVTIAALQFHARAYPEIVNGRSVVQCRVIGEDPQGINTARAERVSAHMSWQLLEQDEAWEEEQDRALLNVPIVGTAFKKSYFNESLGHNVSDLVLAKDLVLDYWAKSVETCPTKTHVIPRYRNEIHERCKRGIYQESVLDESWFMSDAVPARSPESNNADNRAGQQPPESNSNTPFTLLEQHCVLDLDGDGYAEPYIVTIEESSQCVLRIVTAFTRIEDVEYNDKKEIIKITPLQFFTKIPFIPSPDGGIMDVGFGVLIGPLNESVNSSINQLIDAATMANTAGGFLGRGAKIRGGVYSFAPFEWNRVDSTGDDLRKNILPLPVREPSAVMFNLLNMLIDYTNKISGATDMLTGVNPGQNTPAETSRAMIEQGQKIYSSIFKRVWRSMKQEFKKLFILNSIHLPVKTPFGAGGSYIMREDYQIDAGGVCPVADPLITSEAARFAQARLLAERADAVPGYEPDEVEKIYLKALGITNIAVVYPGQAAMPEPAPDVKLQIQQMKTEVEMAKLENSKLSFIATLQEQQRVNNAKIEHLMAEAFKAKEEGEGVKPQDQINAFIAATAAMRDQNQVLDKQVQSMLKEIHHARDDTRERDLARMAKPSNDKKAS